MKICQKCRRQIGHRKIGVLRASQHFQPFLYHAQCAPDAAPNERELGIFECEGCGRTWRFVQILRMKSDDLRRDAVMAKVRQPIPFDYEKAMAAIDEMEDAPLPDEDQDLSILTICSQECAEIVKRRRWKRLEVEARKARRLEAKGERHCLVCNEPIPESARADVVTCSARCRQRKRRTSAA